jgi:predicted N-acetyltransferase YhbS
MGFETLDLLAPEPLTAIHDCSEFRCGKTVLDHWLRNLALHNQESHFTRTFVACDRRNRVRAYYALCAGMISRGDLARSQTSHGMPAEAPVALLARLAVHEELHGQGIGRRLLANALRTAAAASPHLAFRGVVVGALDDEAAAFYHRLGFRPTRINKLKLLLPMDDVLASLIAASD